MLRPFIAVAIAVALTLPVACNNRSRNSSTSGGPATPVDPCPAPADIPVGINEAMLVNNGSVIGSAGALPWIELFNPSATAFDLGGARIRSEGSDPREWEIPCIPAAVIDAGGFLVLFFSDANQSAEDLLIDFLPPATGTVELRLIGSNTNHLASIDADALAADASAGRTPDGQGGMVLLAFPTPGAPNSGPLVPPPATFVRGDIDEDGDVDAADIDTWISIVHFGSGALPCADRFDANDDGETDIADPDLLALAIAPGGPAIPAPFPFAGEDPTADGLPCDGTPIASPPFPPGLPGPGGAAFVLSIASALAEAGEAVALPISIDSPVAFGGFAFGLVAPTGELAIAAIDAGSATLAAAGGVPDFFGVNLAPVGDEGATVGCLLRLSPPFVEIPAGAGLEIAVLHGTVAATAAPGTLIPVEFSDLLGDPAIATRVTVGGESFAPLAGAGEIEVTAAEPAGPSILRGDVSGDGVLRLGDPITLATYIAAGGTAPGCPRASDFDDDGSLDMDDVLGLLHYLFIGGAPPALPFPACAADPTPDALPCATPPECP